jgi:hypothetical protein
MAGILSLIHQLMSQETNPYLTPSVNVTPPSLDSHAEQIRRAHLKHEASVRSIGTLYLLGAILMIVSGSILLVSGSKEFEPTVSAVFVLLGGLYVAVGIALRRLRKWSRIVATIFACIGLLGFPVGTLISAYILYLLLSAKGTMVFSPEYKQIIAETPHVKYQSSKAVKWILIIMVVIFVTIVAIGIFMK